jgi:hypothetical protein
MLRRTLLSAALAAPLWGDAAGDGWEALTALVSALGRGSAEAFAAGLDREMAGREALQNDVAALVGQNEVQCALELVSNQGDERARTIEVMWLLVLTERSETPRTRRRRERVVCRFEKVGKKWLLKGMEPAGFLAAPRG